MTSYKIRHFSPVLQDFAAVHLGDVFLECTIQDVVPLNPCHQSTLWYRRQSRLAVDIDGIGPRRRNTSEIANDRSPPGRSDARALEIGKDSGRVDQAWQADCTPVLPSLPWALGQALSTMQSTAIKASNRPHLRPILMFRCRWRKMEMHKKGGRPEQSRSKPQCGDGPVQI